MSMFQTTLKGFALAGTAAVALFATSAAHAAAIAVTFNPGAVVSNASAFTADKLNLLDFSRVDVASSGAFTESGILQVNNASLNNVTFNPTGNGSTYSLYLSYSAMGTQSAPNFNGSSVGTISGLTYTLYEVAGAATYGINTSNQAFVSTGGNTPVALATGTLINGSTSFSATPLGASANITASFAQILSGFITSPTNTTLTLAGAFNNDSNIVTVLNNGSAFTLNGGGGDLTFSGTPVPEPATLALLGTSLVGLGALRRRSTKK